MKIELPEKLIQLLENSVNDGILVDGGGNKCSFAGFTVKTNSSTKTLSLNQFLSLDIYLSDEEKHILSLQSQIDSLEAKLKVSEELRLDQRRCSIRDTREAHEIADNATKKPRASYKHLSRDEVEEIELMFRKDKSTSVNCIVGAYETSTSVIYRIRLGEHTKSSVKHQAWVKQQPKGW